MRGTDDAPSIVADDEALARFVLQSNRLRADGTVKPDAFIPHPFPDLSVTRHLEWGEHRIWWIGQKVATQLGKRLLARADVLTATYRRCRLEVVSAPEADNLHHANVVGWPMDKPSQKSLAQEIAATAKTKTAPG